MNEAREKTPAKTTKNMEYRQYGESSRKDHALHHSRHTNRRKSKNNTIPCYKHRKRRHHTRIPLDGHFRTPVHVEELGYPRKRIAHYPLVGQSLHSRKRPDNRTNEGIKQRLSCAGHDLHGTRHQGATVHKKGGSPRRVSTICQGIQRRGVKTIPTKMSLGSRNRIQERCTRSSRL